MTGAEHGPLDPALVATLYVEHADELRRFVWGVLRDATLTQDVLQTTFAKLVEQGGGTRSESRKAWLFRVAFHAALEARRRSARSNRALEGLAALRPTAGEPAEANVVRWETVETVRRALLELPPEQQQVVRMRMYEEKSFSQIAQELGIPLGTALGRMHLAVRKLRTQLRPADRHET